MHTLLGYVCDDLRKMCERYKTLAPVINDQKRN